jgi:very-short-patch-repair endonuclease
MGGLIAEVSNAVRGLKYAVQRPFFVADGISFIADFYIPKFGLVVEVDGSDHRTLTGRAKDAWRTTVLQEINGVVDVVRFANNELDNPIVCKRKLIGALLASPKSNSFYKRKLWYLGQSLQALQDGTNSPDSECGAARQRSSDPVSVRGVQPLTTRSALRG